MAARAKLALLLLTSALAFIALPAVGATAWRVSGAAAPAAEKPAPGEATVQIAGFRMVPDRLEITTGTTVTWVNNEPIDYPAVGGSHELVADDGSWKSASIAPGTRWSRRFDQPGTVTYHSSQHSTAAGTIEVTGDPIVERPLEQEVAITEENPDDPTTWGFQPADVVIQAGTTVIWRNNGKSVHTVSADDKSFESGDIPPGGTWKHTFDTPGAFAYHCSPHPWMKGQIRIVAPGSDPPPPAVPQSEHADHQAQPVHRAAGAPPERVGRGPVRHEVAIVEPNPAKPFDWTFDPATLDIKTGDTVVWRNTGSVEHTVTGAAFDSGLLKPGATWEHTFGTTGVFTYNCTPHPWMKAVLRVTEPDAEALPPLVVPTQPTAATAPTPRAAEAIRTGDGPVRHEALIVEPNLQDAMKWTFDPPRLEARVGDTVTWRNTGTLQHTATADSNAFDSGMVDPGATFEHTFDQPGVYVYHCTPHPWMKATVRVTNDAGGEPPVIAAAAPGEQAAAPLDPAALRGRIAISPTEFRPSMIFPIALGISAAVIFITVFLAGRPWRRRGNQELGAAVPNGSA
jgi:plastocyanin